MNGTGTKMELSPKEREKLLKALQARFENNRGRHKGTEWAKVQAKLEASAGKLWSLSEMEKTGGEPDVVGHDNKTGETLFFDCSPESPKGRVSVCYDREGLESRKEHREPLIKAAFGKGTANLRSSSLIPEGGQL